jgi:hypothetical protein
VIPAHDGDHIKALIAEGRLTEGFTPAP